MWHWSFCATGQVRFSALILQSEKLDVGKWYTHNVCWQKHNFFCHFVKIWTTSNLSETERMHERFVLRMQAIGSVCIIQIYNLPKWLKQAVVRMVLMFWPMTNKDEVFASLEFTLWKFVFCIVTSSRSRKTHVSPMYCILALMWFILFERWRKTWTKGLCVRVWAIVEKEISNQTVDFLFCHCQFNEGSFGRNRK